MSGTRYLGALPSGNLCDMYLIGWHPCCGWDVPAGPRPPEGQTRTTRQGATQPSLTNWFIALAGEPRFVDEVKM